MTDSGRIVAVKVIPRSQRESVECGVDGSLTVRTRAVPEDGKATEAVRRLIAAHLGVGAAQVELVTGAKSRRKLFRILGP